MDGQNSIWIDRYLEIQNRRGVQQYLGTNLERITKKIGIINSLVKELWRLGMVWSLKKHGDTKEVIELIVEEQLEDKLLRPLISDCRMLLLEFKRFKIRDVFREANGVADIIAKKAANLGINFIVLIDSPIGVLSILRWI